MDLISIIQDQHEQQPDESASLVERLRFLEESNSALIAIQNKLERLSHFHSEMVPSYDIHYILERGLGKFQELVKTKVCSVFLVHDQGYQFVHKASIPAELAPAVQREVEAQIQSGTFGWIINSGMPACVPADNFKGDQDHPLSILMAPLTHREKTLGVVVILFEEDQDFIRQQTLKLLYILAGFFSLAIQNAYLFSDLKSSYFDTIRGVANSGKSYAGNPFCLAAILAHELCHVVYAERIDETAKVAGYVLKPADDDLEEERTIDLLVILLGMVTSYTVGGFIHVLLVIAVIIVGGWVMFGRSPAQSGELYEDPQGRFTMQVDPSWERVETGGRYTQFKVSDPPQNMYFLVLEASTVDEAFSQAFDMLGFDPGLLEGGGFASAGDWQLYIQTRTPCTGTLGRFRDINHADYDCSSRDTEEESCTREGRRWAPRSLWSRPLRCWALPPTRSPSAR